MVVPCVSLIFALGASAEDVDPAKMRSDLVGSVVALRQPLRGSEITFESDGKPIPPIQRGSFARDALFRIDDLKLEGTSLLLSCHRVILLARATGKGLEFFPTDEKTRIVVVFKSREADDVRVVLDGIFRKTVETESLVDKYGRAFTKDRDLEPDRPVYQCKLQPIARPEPYGPAGGRMVAKVIVNEHGEPEAIGILSAPRLKGNTKIFIATLWNWRFAPYLRNGKPTSCAATVSMRFENPMRGRLNCNHGC
jgi:hypothetical protein